MCDLVAEFGVDPTSNANNRLEENEMPMPPDWLVAWTDYGLKLLAMIAAIKALWTGATLFALKADQIRQKGQEPKGG